MDVVFLADLSHTSQGICSETIPYAIGSIKSYFNEHASERAQLQLFKYPEKLAEALFEERPTVVGFSNYMWNLDLSHTLAAAIKEVASETLIVFGGPNFPLETHLQEAWLIDHPSVDIYIGGEGEEPFCRVLELWLSTHSIDAVKSAGIYGTYALVDGRLEKYVRTRADGYDDTPRMGVLDQVPSPYLMGYLDEFLADPALVPLMEGNRGCPFTCTFCADGIGAHSKIHRKSLDTLEAELVYIAERYPGTYLWLADLNFGMYKQDVEFCRSIADVKKRFGYPMHLQVSTGKNQQERIIECVDILEGSLRFSAAVQSLDEQVLANIKRSNIAYEQLIAASSHAAGKDANTYSEVILGLPGDSYRGHMESVSRLIDANLNLIKVHTLIVLPGSELATSGHREDFDLKTRFRVTARSFGIYPFGDRRLRSAEIEEVSVETRDLTFDDYVACRLFALTVAIFYSENIFLGLCQLIRNAGMKVSDWVKFVHEQRRSFPPPLRKLYDDFEAETVGELTEEPALLSYRLKNELGFLERYIRGERGNNVLLNTQARAYVSCMDELHEVAFDSARRFLFGVGDGLASVDWEYFDELGRFSAAKKGRFLKLDESFEEDFAYNFAALESGGFQETRPVSSPTRIRLYYTDDQRLFFTDQLSRIGQSLQALGKILSRVPVKQAFRSSEEITNA